MNRIISFYPLENRPALLEDLSATLKSVVFQRLVKNKAGGRNAVVEVMLNTRHMADLIQKGEINEMKDAMEKSLSPGSQTFEQGLFKMLQEGTITQEEALLNADSATNLLWLINNTEAGGSLGAGAGNKGTKDSKPASDPSSDSFSEFKLDTSETS